MFDSQRKKKKNALEPFACSGNYQTGFFAHFDSFSEAKRNVKALVALPIVNLSLALHATLDTLLSTIFGVANIAIGALTFDLDELKTGRRNLSDGAVYLKSALYFAASIITDTLTTLVRLVTHSLATVAFGASKIGEAISGCFASSSESPEFQSLLSN